MNIKNQLLDLASLSHKKFTSALIPNINNIFGIKTPELRKIAKEIAMDYVHMYYNSRRPHS